MRSSRAWIIRLSCTLSLGGVSLGGASLGGVLFAAVSCGGTDATPAVEGPGPFMSPNPSPMNPPVSLAPTGDRPPSAATPPSGTPSEPTLATPTPLVPTPEMPAPAMPMAEPEAPVAPLDNSLRRFEADDPNILYSGRVDRANPKQPTYSAPGVSVTAHFRGISIAALLADEFRYGNERGFHDVVIDGQIMRKIRIDPGVERYELASGLTDGEHTVSIVKRTQASLGKAIFRGFEIEGQLLSPAPEAALRIEFIGDSISAGEGVEAVNGSAECGQNALGATGGWGQPFHDGNRSYAAVAARELGAEFHLTAVSGIGLVRNYSQQYDARTMADVYGLTFVEEVTSVAWNPSLFVPEIVVIALGTNDFSPGDSPPNNPRPRMSVATYTDAYAAFVRRLRALYPEAEIFALTSQLLSDGSPDASYTSATDLRTAINNVAQMFAAQGDSRVHAFVTARIGGRGCTGHPDVAQQEQLGRDLAQAIRPVVGR